MARARKPAVVDADFRVVDSDGRVSFASFDAAPSPELVTQLSDAQKALLSARMEMVLAALESARRKAVDIATLWPSYNWQWLVASAIVPPLAAVVGTFGTPAEAKAAVIGVLNNSIALQIANGRRNMAEVLAGTLSVEKWMAGRRGTAEGIKVVLQSLKENTTALNLTATMNDVWNDIANMIQWLATKTRELPSKLPDTSVVLYAALALGALVLYQYLMAPLRMLPQRRLSGYTRRRTRSTRR